MTKRITYYPDTGSWLEDVNLHPVLRRIYVNRGIRKQEEIAATLSNLLPWHGLLGIDLAVDIIYQALKNQQRILIVGDYDVDGATSTALMMKVLKAFGAASVDYIVPNRFENGYGLSPTLIDSIDAANRPDLIITVDNGISSFAGIDAANAAGIVVVVTDHHLVGDTLPAAAAIVNPNCEGDTFPSKNLAGVGVAFYLVMALRAKLRQVGWFQVHDIPEPNLAAYLDLVALGTIADMVELDRNNRILVHQGILRIRGGKCSPGITALLKIARREPEHITTCDLSFTVGPRLNAAGRLDDMSQSVECLLAQDTSCARRLAKQLSQLNQERKAIERDMHAEALDFLNEEYLQMQTDCLPMGLCLMDERWHQGVVGILASRIKDRFNRPVIAFARFDDDELKGSARSVAGIHLREILAAIATRYPDMIVRFGGHAMAAGLSVKKAQYDIFAQVFNDEVSRRMENNLLPAAIVSDGALTASDITFELAQLLQIAHPWGQGFPEPLFDGEFRLIEQRIVGRHHLKLTVELGDQLIEAIKFNVDVSSWPNHRCEMAHIVYRLQAKTYHGRRFAQLMIEEITPV